MSKIKDNILRYKTQIKHGFEDFDPGNNDYIESGALNELIKSMNSQQKSPFLYNLVKSLTAQKREENEQTISFEEYMSSIDNQLNDTETREGLKKIPHLTDLEEEDKLGCFKSK